MIPTQNQPHMIDGTRRIQTIATLACSLARSCAFSNDADWFWQVATTEVDRYMLSGGRPAKAQIQAPRSAAA